MGSIKPESFTEHTANFLSIPRENVYKLREKAIVFPPKDGKSERIFLNGLGDTPSVRSFQSDYGQTSKVLDVSLDGSYAKLDDKNQKSGGIYEIKEKGMIVLLNGAEIDFGDKRRNEIMEIVLREVNLLKQKLQRHFGA